MNNTLISIILYIDPGTGAMLFSVLMGLVSVLFFAIKAAIVKIKFWISGGRVEITTYKIPLVIFAESKRYWNVFSSICEELEKRQFGCEYWTTSQDDPIFEKNYVYVKAVYIGEGNKAFSKLNLMNAKMCLSTTPGLEVFQWKRSKSCDKYIHIFHNVAEPVLYRMFGIDYYDIILVMGDSEEDYIRSLEKIRGLPEKQIVLVGSTYLDELARCIDNCDIKKQNDIPTILLAPSWGEASITNRYGEKMIDALVNTGYNIIFRPHPQSFTSDKQLMDRLIKKYPDSDKFEWDRNTNNFESLLRADVMVSDFSGIIYDYAFCFNKPVIFSIAGLDLSVYDAWWLDGDSWSVKNLPNVGVELKTDDLADIKKVIDSLLDNKEFHDRIQMLKSYAWKNMGDSSKLIADYIIENNI